MVKRRIESKDKEESSESVSYLGGADWHQGVKKKKNSSDDF